MESIRNIKFQCRNRKRRVGAQPTDASHDSAAQKDFAMSKQRKLFIPYGERMCEHDNRLTSGLRVAWVCPRIDISAHRQMP
jgi:hypothetical protein